MTILEGVKERRSIRKFQDRTIPEEMIVKLKEALIWAPSAGNLQARKFFFVFDAGKKKELSAAALNQDCIASAPLSIVACTDNGITMHYGERGEFLYSVQDVSASIMCMMLVAHELGLGSVWVGAFHEDQVSKILELPENYRPVSIIPVGFPRSIPKAPERISADYAVTEIT